MIKIRANAAVLKIYKKILISKLQPLLSPKGSTREIVFLRNTN